ncbi:MAG: cyclic nucleotide-binding domain-containing protein [Chloroflexi bacterium]|nr:cyclic nucleotide-binding domain-containing protein [Chloroflexota bacterium]
MDKIALINQTFSELADDEVRNLAEHLFVRAYPAGTYLCREGEFGDVFYILARGRAKITMKTGDGDDERVLRVIGPGEFFGEMGLIQNSPRAANVVTISEAAVLEMQKADFGAVLSASPHMAISLIRSTLDRLRSNDQLIIQELRRINATLKRLDRNKIEFIEVAAHELRTPLTVLMGYAGVLEIDPATQSDPMLKDVAAGILKGAERLLHVVNTMLDVTRISTGKLRLSPAPVLLKSAIGNLISQLKPDIAARQLEVTQEHDPDTPIVNGDPPLIEKALQHLILNAIKYTPDGGRIHIRTRPAALEDDQPGVEVSIRDSGIGLDKAEQELVFEKFYQVGPSSLHSSGKASFKAGGQGMGLAIARGVAESHGGKLWVESEGHDEARMPGSTFFLLLPINPSPDAA